MADSEIRRNLEVEAAALVELEHRKRDFPLWFYKPVPKCEAFHSSRAIIRLLVGANRSSKSETSHAEAAAYALGYRPWKLRELGLPMPAKPWERPANLPDEAICFNGAGIRVGVPNTGLIMSGLSLKRGAGEVSLPKLQKLLGPLIEKVRLGHAGTPAEVVLKNGSNIRFGSDEQDRMAQEGVAYHWVAGDEPMKRSNYVALRRGSIDNFAPFWAAFTPIGPNAQWLFRELYSKADGARIFALTLSIYDNIYLSPDAIREFAQDGAISEIEKEARLHGRFQNLVDRIYPEFDEAVHVVDPFTPPVSWPTGLSIDPHSIRPWFIGQFAVSPRGAIYFYNEWPPTDFSKIRRDPRSYDDWAALIRKLEGTRESAIRLGDPNYMPRKDTLRGTMIPSIASEMEARGLLINHHLNDDLTYGEGKVRQLLSYNSKEPITVLNSPKLFFTEDCPNLIASMSFYTAKSRAGTDGEPDELKREEQYKDGSDVVRYVAVSDVAQLALADSFQSDYESLDPNADLGIHGAYGEE